MTIPLNISGEAVASVPDEGPAVSVVKKPRQLAAFFSYGWLGLIIFLALTAALLPIADYSKPVSGPLLAPDPGSLDVLFGTDYLGRSMLARCIYGAQVSLIVGVTSGLIGFVIGTTLGMIAGYSRGKADWFVTLLTDAMLAFPPLILLLALSSVLTPSLKTITMGLTLLTIPSFARLARAQTIVWSAREFVKAARNMGASSFRILVKEILPNVVPALAAYLPIVIAALIVAEGSLSFLGLGIPPPRPSWGGMINDNRGLMEDKPFLVFIPAALIFLTVFALNQAGDHLRHKFDKTMHD